MVLSFKEFIYFNDFNCSLFEQEGLYVAESSPEDPKNPNNKTTNKYHFDFLKRQLGLDDINLKSAISGNSIPIFKVPDYSNKWGFLVSGICTAIVEPRPDGNYDVTFQLEDKKLMEPDSCIKPYKKGERPIVYQGEIVDKKETMTAEELQDIMAKPFSGMGSASPAIGGIMGGPSILGV